MNIDNSLIPMCLSQVQMVPTTPQGKDFTGIFAAELITKILRYLEDENSLIAVSQVSRQWRILGLQEIKFRHRETYGVFFCAIAGCEQIRSTPERFNATAKNLKLQIDGYLSSVHSAKDIVDIKEKQLETNAGIRSQLRDLELADIIQIFSNIDLKTEAPINSLFVTAGNYAAIKLQNILQDPDFHVLYNLRPATINRSIEEFNLLDDEIKIRIYNKAIQLHLLLTEVTPELGAYVDLLLIERNILSIYTIFHWLLRFHNPDFPYPIIQIQFSRLFDHHPSEFLNWLPFNYDHPDLSDSDDLRHPELFPPNMYLLYVIYPLCYLMVKAQLSRDEILNKTTSIQLFEEIIPSYLIQLSLQLLRVGRIEESLILLSTTPKPNIPWVPNYVRENPQYHEDFIFIYTKKLAQYKPQEAVRVLMEAYRISPDFYNILLKHMVYNMKTNCPLSIFWQQLMEHLKLDPNSKVGFVNGHLAYTHRE